MEGAGRPTRCLSHLPGHGIVGCVLIWHSQVPARAVSTFLDPCNEGCSERVTVSPQVKDAPIPPLGISKSRGPQRIVSRCGYSDSCKLSLNLAPNRAVFLNNSFMPVIRIWHAILCCNACRKYNNLLFVSTQACAVSC